MILRSNTNRASVAGTLRGKGNEVEGYDQTSAKH